MHRDYRPYYRRGNSIVRPYCKNASVVPHVVLFPGCAKEGVVDPNNPRSPYLQAIAQDEEALDHFKSLDIWPEGEDYDLKRLDTGVDTT
jgi:hypothetical protein